MDEHMWDNEQGLWLDLTVVGGGDSVAIPTLDGVFGALATASRDRAQRALDQLMDPRRFASSYGLRYLPPDHPDYDPDEYWRGPAWPQLNYMAYVAANRWARPDVADAIRTMSLRGAVESGFSEYCNAETGAGRGARPQGWAAIAAARL
jgi:glycogen debranching enzyme